MRYVRGIVVCVMLRAGAARVAAQQKESAEPASPGEKGVQTTEKSGRLPVEADKAAVPKEEPPVITHHQIQVGGRGPRRPSRRRSPPSRRTTPLPGFGRAAIYCRIQVLRNRSSHRKPYFPAARPSDVRRLRSRAHDVHQERCTRAAEGGGIGVLTTALR